MYVLSAILSALINNPSALSLFRTCVLTICHSSAEVCFRTNKNCCTASWLISWDNRAAKPVAVFCPKALTWVITVHFEQFIVFYRLNLRHFGVRWVTQRVCSHSDYETRGWIWSRSTWYPRMVEEPNSTFRLAGLWSVIYFINCAIATSFTGGESRQRGLSWTGYAAGYRK